MIIMETCMRQDSEGFGGSLIKRGSINVNLI